MHIPPFEVGPGAAVSAKKSPGREERALSMDEERKKESVNKEGRQRYRDTKARQILKENPEISAQELERRVEEDPFDQALADEIREDLHLEEQMAKKAALDNAPPREGEPISPAFNVNDESSFGEAAEAETAFLEEPEEFQKTGT